MSGLRDPRILALASLMVWSCASAPIRTDPAIGCYQFEQGAGARTLGLPWGVELDGEPLGPGWPLMDDLAGVRRARTATGPIARDDHPLGYWRPAAGDSIEIGHPGGGGVALMLSPRGQDLIGTGTANGDAIPLGSAPDPRVARAAPAQVVARRVLCGAS